MSVELDEVVVVASFAESSFLSFSLAVISTSAFDDLDFLSGELIREDDVEEVELRRKSISP